MLTFKVQPNSAAFRMLRRLTSPQSTNMATQLATAGAFAKVKQHYTGRWRAATKGGNTLWQEFKAAMGFGMFPGELTGTTFRSIRYKTKSNTGRVFLEGKWPNINVQEQKVSFGLGGGTSRSTDIAIRGGGSGFGGGGEPDAYDLAVRGESMAEDSVSEQEAWEIFQDMGAAYAESPAGGGRKAGRIGKDAQMMVSGGGLQYIYEGRRFKVRGEAMSRKLYGMSRGGMFQGGKIGRGWGSPKITSAPVDFMVLGDRDRDAEHIMKVVGRYYERLLSKR